MSACLSMTTEELRVSTGLRSSIPPAALACIAGLALAAPLASAQGGDTVASSTPTRASAPAKARPEPKELLELFVHYALIDNRALAASFGQELLDRKLTNAEFVSLVESGDPARFEQAIGRAMKAKELDAVVGPIAKAFEDGKLERSRDPGEIGRNIQALTGPLRGKLIAQGRLKAAGEYAMPQLLDALLDGANPVLQEEVFRLTIDMGRQSVMPLAAALPKLQPAQQAQVADVLGLIGNRSALPFLADLAQTTINDDVREAATRGMDRLGGTGGSSAADLYAKLADAYFRERPELTNFPGEDHQLLWNYDPSSRLTMVPVRTPVFHEAVAMRLAERSLELYPDGADTLALWIAANLRREIQTPKGYINPAYPVSGAAMPGQEPRRDAMYFAVAAGANTCQQVLGRALQSNDPVLARRAIAAIQQTAGGTGLWGIGQGDMPLLVALNYPNRRVQYDAALALAAAAPKEGFSGSDRVVPTLAGAVRDSGVPIAAVITTDAEIYQPLRRLLEGQGFKVLPQGRTLADLAAPIAEAPAVDLFVLHQPSGDALPGHLEAIRSDPKTLATPVFMVSGSDAAISLARRYDGNPMVMVRSSAIGESAMTAGIKQLLEQASGGPISPEEAASYADRALASLRELAIARNPVFKVEDAATPLIAIVSNAEAPSTMRLRAADVVSRIGQDRAQRTLADAAFAASGEDRLALLTLAAESAKRFGNKLEARHITRVVELASSKDDREATAAAALMGALNLPNNQLLPLILKKS